MTKRLPAFLLLVLLAPFVTLHGQSAAPVVPVVLVHGYCSDPATFGRMQAFLQEDLASKGIPVLAYDYSQMTKVADGRTSPFTIQDIAADFRQRLKGFLQSVGAPQADVVAHSMGGMVARSWISGMSGAPYEGEIRRLITLGTPNYGVGISARAKWVNGAGCSAVQYEQLKWGSRFINELHDRWYAAPNRPLPSHLLTVAGVSACDRGNCGDGLVAVQSATLPDADNIRYIPYNHFAMKDIVDRSHVTYQLILDLIRDGSLRDQCCGPGTIGYNPSFLQGVPAAEGFLVVRVRDAEGRPVSELGSLSFEPAAEAPGAFPQYDRNWTGGTFTYFPLLAPGTYNINVELKGGHEAQTLQNVTVQRLRPTVVESVTSIATP